MIFPMTWVFRSLVVLSSPSTVTLSRGQACWTRSFLLSKCYVSHSDQHLLTFWSFLLYSDYNSLTPLGSPVLPPFHISYILPVLVPLHPAELHPQQSLSIAHTFNFLAILLGHACLAKPQCCLNPTLRFSCTWVTYRGPRTTQLCRSVSL